MLRVTKKASMYGCSNLVSMINYAMNFHHDYHATFLVD